MLSIKSQEETLYFEIKINVYNICMSKLRFISLLSLLFYAKLHIYQSILINTVEVERKYLGKSFLAFG